MITEFFGSLLDSLDQANQRFQELINTLPAPPLPESEVVLKQYCHPIIEPL